jgi:ATP-dependent Clp protease ATP-binding subunit ClpC
VGYEEGGQLTEAVRRRPYSVVLLDEIEKAHPEAQNMLLQIMEDGHLSDAKGRRVDFRNAILVMTSNVGANLIKRAAKLGFAFTTDDDVKREQDYENMRDRVTEALKQQFRPEFLNRLDGIMVFRHLTKEELTSIVDLELKRVYMQLSEHDIRLELTPEATLFLAEEGYDPEFGARPLRRVVMNHVEDRLSEGMLAGDFKPGDTVTASVISDEAGKRQLKLEVTVSGPLTAAEDQIAEEILELALA